MRLHALALAGALLACSGLVTAQQIVECPALPPVTGACEVTAGDAGLLVRATILQQDRVLRHGQLLVGADGVIACAACDCSGTPGAATATVVTCPDGVVSPGFVDLHEHASYTTPPVDHGLERYDHRHDWRCGLDGHTEITLSSDTSAAALAWGELRHLLAGTTAMAGGDAAAFVRNLDDVSEMAALSEPALEVDTFPLGDASCTMLTSGCAYPGFSAPQAGRVYVPHVAQGVNAAARNELLCLLDASLVGGHDALHGAAVVDPIALTANDGVRLASRGASVVWSPRHDISLYGMTSPVTVLAGEGVNLALATSWLPTGSSSLHRELECAVALNGQYLGGYFSDRELLGMVTWNAARAAGLDHLLGHLTPGHLGDLVVFDGSSRVDYEAAVLGHPADVWLVLRGGLPLYGEAAVLAALGAGEGICEAFATADCLMGKRVCVTRESGGSLSLATLLASYGAPYSCSTPVGEPTCTPYRDEGDGIVFDGGPTAGDADGDGVADAVDNCPTVFNPPRPVDGFVQADQDGDGVGDVCDDPAATLIYEATFEGRSSCYFSRTVTPELCDGIDNDCDGAVDEGFVLNACGGCAVLPAQPADPCGVCGQYECDGTDAVACAGACALVGFGPQPSYVREGDVAVTTIPDPLAVTLSGTASADTFVSVTSDSAALAVAGGGVTVTAGTSSAPVLVSGVSQSPAVTLTAQLGAVGLDADVRVVGTGEQPAVAAVTPASVIVPPNATTALTVSLDIPAGAGGSIVSLALTPSVYGSVPPSVLVPADLLSASFDFTAGPDEGSEVLTATLGVGSVTAAIEVASNRLVINEVDYDQPSTDTMEFVELYNGAGVPVGLANLALVLVNGATNSEYSRVALGPGFLGAGQYLVVGSPALLATVPDTAMKIAFGADTNKIQNGSPDALAIIDVSAGTVIDALSYEGAVIGDVAGIGLVDFVEGTATSATDAGDGSLIRYPNGTDTDDASSDWAFTSTSTPGGDNVP